MKLFRRSHDRKLRRNAVIQKATAFFETLEERRLLTTLRGGDTYEFLDSQDNIIRIRLEGNIVAEFIGARMSASNDPVLMDLAPATSTAGTGTDLFKIYVTRSDINASISIAAVPELDADERPMLPYDDQVSLNVVSNIDGQIIGMDGPENSGIAYLGARTADLNPNVDDDENRARIAATRTTGLGVMPAPTNGIVTAGLEVVGGQNLGSFLFGGTITGFVNLTGSINNFYAGWILTGDARGYSDGQGIRYADNFRVEGDIRNLMAKGIGRDADGDANEPTYFVGTDIQVRGTVGQVNVLQNHQANIDVRNAVAGPFLQRVMTEVENSLPIELDGDRFQQGLLGDDAHFVNDTFENPQYLGTMRDPAFGGQSAIRVVGQLNPNTSIANVPYDNVDYYGVALLAGQTITVQIPASNLQLGIFDPDGRLVRTNYDSNNYTSAIERAFTFTTDRPGVYRFAVGFFGDYEFANVQSDFGQSDYTLRISNTGEMAVGAIRAGGHITDFALTSQAAIDVWRGDLGAVLTDGIMTSTNFDATLRARFGNVRAIEASQLGYREGDETDIIGGGATYSLAPEFEAPYGHIGLVRATSSSGYFNSTNLTDNAAFWTPIGGDYQVIDVAGSLIAGIITKGNIGVIRAGQMGVDNAASVIAVNADNQGPRGTIDLIDVSGDFGTLEAGGPHITTGRGGNVRYIHVGGSVYRDYYFGGTIDEGLNLSAGQSTTVVDDSGSRVTLSPVFIKNPAYQNGINPSVPEFLNTPAAITVLTYGIRGSGGSAIVSVTASGSINISGVANGRNVSAEIGELNITASGTPVVTVDVPETPTDENGTPTDTPTTNIQLQPLAANQTVRPNAVNVNIAGSLLIDVLETSTLQIDSIVNTTGGELPIIDATSIGVLQGTTLGLAKKHTGAAVNPIATIDNSATDIVEGDSFPFVGQKIGVTAQNIVNVAATQALGNFSIVNSSEDFGNLDDLENPATIQNLVANSDNFNQPGVYEGIVGPIAARRLNNVNIGEGLAWHGSGEMSDAGLYARQDIRTVTGNVGADIRGAIVSNDTIGSITLRDGALISARIMTLMDAGADTAEALFTSWSRSREFYEDRFITFDNDPVDAVVYDIGPITIYGNGGIMDTVVIAHDIDSVLVPDGFGIFTTEFRTLGTGVTNEIRAGGYGIRNVSVRGGATLNGIQANGKGQTISSASFTRDVRTSEFYRYDPFTGYETYPNADLHRYFGTTASQRIIPNVTVGGVIENTAAVGQKDLLKLYAWRVRESQFNFADRIYTIQTSSAMRNVGFTTGQLDFFQSGDSVSNLDVTVAGPVTTFNILGNVDPLSLFEAVGPSGRFSQLRISRNMAGDVYTTGAINKFIVGGDITTDSTITASAIASRTIRGRNLGSLVIG